jgi:hypothetical protein
MGPSSSRGYPLNGKNNEGDKNILSTRDADSTKFEHATSSGFSFSRCKILRMQSSQGLRMIRGSPISSFSEKLGSEAGFRNCCLFFVLIILHSLYLEYGSPRLLL